MGEGRPSQGHCGHDVHRPAAARGHAVYYFAVYAVNRAGRGDNQDWTGLRLAVEVAAAVDKSKDGRAADQRSGARADGGGPPASDTRSVPYSMPAVTFSFRFGEGQIFRTNATTDESLMSCRHA